MKKLMPVGFILLIVIVFFWQFFLKGFLPIPSDTIIGLYHPFRDLYAKDYPNGIPFKNFLITDPVRQQYPWKELAIWSEKKIELPLWNPYSFAGTPLLANMQSGAFYPLNILFFILPFNIAWSVLIFLQPLLAGVFLYIYLRNLRMNTWASAIGSIVFAFSGFSTSWLEWGTIVNTALWLPLILLSTDKIASGIKNRKVFAWSLVYLFSLIFAFFAGHLQTFFYLFIFSSIYFFAKWMQVGWQKKILFLFFILNSLFIIFTAVQWIPTLRFILLSTRNVDQVGFNNPGWFVPWQNLIQFIAPDFFGNPSTLNYWGIWNYGEFIAYVGILPLIMAIFAIFFRHDRKTLFFGTAFFLSLIFALPTIFAKIPFTLNVPFVSTSQPTRLLFITDFSLAILSALGFDYFIRSKKRGMMYPLIFIAFMLLGLWVFVFFGNEAAKIVSAENISVAKRNLLFPTLILIVSATLLFSLIRFPKLHKHFTIMIYIIIVAVIAFDLLRFSFKFTPFTDKNYLFPNTRAISFLQEQKGEFRIMTTNSQILPPNFSSIYRLQSVDGYDPLYLRRYAELIAASERKKADINPPFGFNRIITPHNYDSKIMDLLGVKYVLSFSDLDSPKFKKVFQEGQTRVYENKDFLPRAFFVGKTIFSTSKNTTIKFMFDDNFDPINMAIVEDSSFPYVKGRSDWGIGKAEVTYYSPNKIIIDTDNQKEGFLVLADNFYPTWHVKIDANGDSINTEQKIYLTNFTLRGVIVPKGKHTILFYDTLL
ncbi:MAG: YfhO family protein [Candidatus Levybacteria bacterium]|nr:YfhO family protein [Candidatus Levybacteria bacterium]